MAATRASFDIRRYQCTLRDYMLANRLNRDPVAIAEKRHAEKDMKRASLLEKANAKKLETVAKKIQDKAWLACMTAGPTSRSIESKG